MRRTVRRCPRAARQSAAIFASPDGNHVAYAGLRDGEMFVGRDGVEDPAFEAFTRSVPPVFGGSHLAYGARPVNGEFRLVVDGQVIGTAEVAPMEAVFSPDGERLAYVEMRGEQRGRIEYRIVLDGQAGEWFVGMRNAPGAMQFSPDGRRFAYYTIDGSGHGRWFVDGVGQRVINDVRPVNLARIQGVGVVDPPLPARFSPDSRRFAYFADVIEKGVAIIEDDVPGPLLKTVRAPTFSLNSNHLAYAGRTFAGTAALVLDGAIVGEWSATGIGQPVFSNDGNRLAMTLERKAGALFRKHSVWSLVVDGRKIGDEPGEDASLYPVFSTDGRHVAQWIRRRDGRAALIVDGIAQDVLWSVESDVRFDFTGRPVYAAKIGTSKTVVVGYQPGPMADDMVSLRTLDEAFGRDPWISPPSPFRITAGANVAWVGRFGDSYCPVLDGEVGPTFDSIVACRVDPGVATWWAQRGQTVFRVQRELGPVEVIASGTPATVA